MTTNIEIIETALEQLIAGHSAPAFEGPEFETLIGAIKNLPPDEYHLIGARSLTILLDRLMAGMLGERMLKVMFGGENPRHIN